LESIIGDDGESRSNIEASWKARNGMAQKFSVQCGDRFVKVGSRTSTLVVKRVVEIPDLQPHVQLVSERRDGRPMTVSVSALLDRRLFAPANEA